MSQTLSFTSDDASSTTRRTSFGDPIGCVPYCTADGECPDTTPPSTRNCTIERDRFRSVPVGRPSVDAHRIVDRPTGERMPCLYAKVDVEYMVCTRMDSTSAIIGQPSWYIITVLDFNVDHPCPFVRDPTHIPSHNRVPKCEAYRREITSFLLPFNVKTTNVEQQRLAILRLGSMWSTNYGDCTHMGTGTTWLTILCCVTMTTVSSSVLCSHYTNV